MREECESGRRRFTLQVRRVAFGPNRMHCCPGLSRATSARDFLPSWPGGLPAHRMLPLEMPPTFPGARRWRRVAGGQAAARCHRRPSASPAATAPAATSVPARRGAHTFLSTRSQSGAWRRLRGPLRGGPRGLGRLRRWLSVLRRFEVGP